MSENFKIYLIIFLGSLFVVLLGVRAFESAKARLLELSNANKITISQNLISAFQSWLDERVGSLQRASIFIEHGGMIESESQIASFLQTFAQNSPEFDMVQLLLADGRIWVDGKKLRSKDYNFELTGLVWYVLTRDKGEPIVHFMPRHYVLGQETLNFCVPNFYSGKFRAVLCGIVKVQSIFEKIKDFKLPPNAYSFIVTNGGQILTPFGDERLKAHIEEAIKELFLRGSEQRTINLGSNFISISEIKFLDWFVGAGADTRKETSELLSDMGKNGIMVLGGFLLFAVLANLLHNAAYTRIDRHKQEYELILTHKARMSEIGELISGINHQFIQPVNSLKLIISSLLELRVKGELGSARTESLLQKAGLSLTLLGDTIEIFRNFYKTSEVLSKFSVRQSIKNLLTLMHTELSRANVSVDLSDFEDCEVCQIENIIQQILLILLHNAKDAVVEKFSGDFRARRVSIKVRFDEKFCYIKVSDFGGGVESQTAQKIFQTPKTTKKSGSGIGLYFAKKLAISKLSGDLRLISHVNPTIFELKFTRCLADTLK